MYASKNRNEREFRGCEDATDMDEIASRKQKKWPLEYPQQQRRTLPADHDTVSRQFHQLPRYPLI